MAVDEIRIGGAKEHNLKNLSLSIPRDQLVVVTGLSGSGKSSLMDYIAGFKINNNLFNKENYISPNNFAYSSQHPFLFKGTLIENIILDNSNFNEKKLSKIIKFLSLEKIINKNGFSTIYNPELNFLSGGESQRISIARALYSESPFILLDEPTAKLDKKTSEKILNNLPHFIKNRTLIIIMHENIIPDWIDGIVEILN